MTFAEIIHRLVQRAIKNRRFHPEFQERTTWTGDVLKKERNREHKDVASKNSR